jgi:photosystem II stability/assembly factor-like uncharacterized protein
MRLLACAVAMLAAVVIPGSATAGTSVGHSGWYWGNPTPQGSALTSIDFSGERGFAAGQFGTLLRSDDGGATWTGIPTGITFDISRVRVLDANNLVVGGGCSLRRSTNGGQTFTRLPFTPSDLSCKSQIASFAVPSSNTVFVATQDGNVLSSSDAGQTFTRQNAVPGTAATGGGAKPTDIIFTSDTNGVAITDAGVIFRTVNGGGSWTQVGGAGAPLNSLTFVDANNGFAVGNGPVILRTADGGVTWSQRPLAGSGGGNLRSIRCATPTLCIITTAAGDRLIRTTDGGDTASQVSASAHQLFAAAFSSATRAVAVGDLGTTVLSNDAGTTYSPIGDFVPGKFGRMRAVSATLAYATGENGGLARTNDGGQNWTTLGVPTSENIRDIAFVNQSIGYALDAGGGLFRTDNGGSSWRLLDTGDVHAAAIAALDAQRVVLVGPKGIRISTNGGVDFPTVESKVVKKTTLSNVDVQGETIFAWSGRALVRSTNGGRSWQAVKRPVKSNVADYDFTSAKIGWALAGDGSVWRTANARKWKRSPSTGTNAADHIAFGNGTNGFLSLKEFAGSKLGGNGVVLRTSDGGKSWRPQLVSLRSLFTDLVAPTGSTAFVSNQLLSVANQPAGTSFFGTATGGDQGATSNLSLKTKSTRITRKALKRQGGEIKLTGRVNPAEGREDILLAYHPMGKVDWNSQIVEADSSGKFTAKVRISRTSDFVIQWLGDDDRTGAGSKVLTVKVR